MKEKTFFINIKENGFDVLCQNIFKEVVDSFLLEHQNIDIDSMIYENNLSDVYSELLKDNSDNVKDKLLLYDTLEKIYDYWRYIKRYALCDINSSSLINEDNFLTQFDIWNEAVLKAYRKLCHKLTGKKFLVYRQLPAFADALLLLKGVNSAPYKELNNVELISKIAFRTPFVSYSASNIRTGFFPIINQNPINGLDLNNERWFVLPLLCGMTRMLIYFPKRYISLGISLSNLFQIDESYNPKEVDAVILFGSNTIDGVYYDSKENKYIGSLVACDKIDYFGYLKKLILTVHNIKMINEGKLPIHGAGVSILLDNGEKKNVVIIGDSGAGKSETLEALKEIADDKILDIITIYDDMGTFEIIDGKVFTYGTEIGAFVRTDDLAHDYVYKVFDRAIFLNPNKHNSRLVLPITPYHDVVRKYKVDYVLYANNYENNPSKVVLFKTKDEALKVFKEGKRVALGTTSESGLVSTFFANPFGPVQLEKKTNDLLDEYFETLFKNSIPVGQLFTCLSLPNGKEDVKESAKKLFNLLIK